jgi:hypothetical protein
MEIKYVIFIDALSVNIIDSNLSKSTFSNLLKIQSLYPQPSEKVTLGGAFVGFEISRN